VQNIWNTIKLAENANN